MGNVAKSGSSTTIRKPVDTKPIDKDDLVAAYLERHRDSDYGFQAEFEQNTEKEITFALKLPK